MAAATATDADDHDAEAETKRVLSTAAGWDRNMAAAFCFRNWLEDEQKPLRVWGCKITRLPDSFGNLSSVTILICSNNQLTSLPDTIGNLKSLSKLLCFRNQLTSLPDSTGDLISLTKFWCSDNPLTSLPASLGHLPLLTELICNNNKIPEGEPSTLEELQAIAQRRSVKGRTGI